MNFEGGRMKVGRQHCASIYGLLFILLPSSFILGFAGCTQKAAPTTRPASMHERQDQAIKDPFGYSPGMENTDISGGGFREFDKDGFRKDLNNVLDP
jgi:hypothetical protein